MGYQVKWVEENLGVSRKALRNFERMGLMKPNEDRKYRDYSDEDIERIWTIRLLQGIGYSLKEIVNMSENEEFDFDKSLSKKIEELEEKKAEIEKSLGYAKYIKFSGRIPYGPKELGSITAEEFHHKALNEWNVNNDEEIKKHQEIADILLNSPEEDLEDTELGKLIEVLTEFSEILSNPDNLMAEIVIPKEILKRKDNGAACSEVQLLVKMLYDYRSNTTGEDKMTLSQFVRFESSFYMNGDIARMKEKQYGKEGCAFIADAIAVFGGYNGYEEVVDQ